MAKGKFRKTSKLLVILWYHVSFYLWQIVPVLWHCKVPKPYDQNCSLNLQFFKSYKHCTHTKKFSIKGSFSKCDQIRSSLRITEETADLVTFTEEMLNGKLQFLCSEDHENKPLHVWSLPPYKTALLSKKFCVTMYTNSKKLLCKKNVLKYFGNFTGKHLCSGLFSKEILPQVFSSKIFENFKNTYSKEHLWTTAPECFRKINLLLVLGKPM